MTAVRNLPTSNPRRHECFCDSLTPHAVRGSRLTRTPCCRLRIDDPLCAAPMHGFCGAWGVLFAGLLAKQQYICESYGRDCTAGNVPDGLFYRGNGRLLASQVRRHVCRRLRRGGACDCR